MPENVVCASEFMQRDPKDPKYSSLEYDIYAWIPYGKGEDHRLSIRYNFQKSEFEAYAYYYRDRRAKVLFSSPALREVLAFVTKIEQEFFEDPEVNYVECEHKKPYKSLGCEVKEG